MYIKLVYIKKILIVAVIAAGLYNFAYAACTADVSFGNKAESTEGPTITGLRQPYQLHEAVNMYYARTRLGSGLATSLYGTDINNIDILSRSFSGLLPGDTRPFPNIVYISDRTNQTQSTAYATASIGGKVVNYYLSGVAGRPSTTSTIVTNSKAIIRTYMMSSWDDLLKNYANSASNPEFYNVYKSRAVQFLYELTPLEDMPKFYGTDSNTVVPQGPSGHIEDVQQRRGGVFVRYKDGITYATSQFSPWIRLDKKEIVTNYVSISSIKPVGSSAIDTRNIWMHGDKSKGQHIYAGSGKNNLITIKPDQRNIASDTKKQYTWNKDVVFSHSKLGFIASIADGHLRASNGTRASTEILPLMRAKVGSLVFNDSGNNCSSNGVPNGCIYFSNNPVRDIDVIHLGVSSSATKFMQIGESASLASAGTGVNTGLGNAYIGADKLIIEAGSGNSGDVTFNSTNMLTDISQINFANSRLITDAGGISSIATLNISANNSIIDFNYDNAKNINDISIVELLTNYFTSDSTVVFDIINHNGFDANSMAWTNVSTLVVGSVRFGGDTIDSTDGATLMISAPIVDMTDNMLLSDISTLTVEKSLEVSGDTIRSLRGLNFDFYNNTDFSGDDVAIEGDTATLEIQGNQNMTIVASGAISAEKQITFLDPASTNNIKFTSMEVLPKNGSQNTAKHYTQAGNIRIKNNSQITTDSGDLVLKAANNTIDLSGLYLAELKNADTPDKLVTLKQVRDTFNNKKLSDFSPAIGNLDMNGVVVRKHASEGSNGQDHWSVRVSDVIHRTIGGSASRVFSRQGTFGSGGNPLAGSSTTYDWYYVCGNEGVWGTGSDAIPLASYNPTSKGLYYASVDVTIAPWDAFSRQIRAAGSYSREMNDFSIISYIVSDGKSSYGSSAPSCNFTGGANLYSESGPPRDSKYMLDHLSGSSDMTHSSKVGLTHSSSAFFDKATNSSIDFKTRIRSAQIGKERSTLEVIPKYTGMYNITAICLAKCD